MKKFSLSIGIPAYNEEANIKNMIESVLKQKGESFTLEKIFVLLDGCTDNTLKIVKSIAKKDRRIKVINDGKRTGKAARLNQIYKFNKSELVGTFDADIFLERDCELEIMVKEFLASKKVNVVAAKQYPASSNTLMGRFSNASFLMLQNSSLRWRNGNNIHSLQGSASLLRAKFARSFTFPPDTVTDAGYLYLKATQENKSGFRIAKNTRVIFRTVSTFSDWRRLGERTLNHNKQGIFKHFGHKGLRQYYIPGRILYRGILRLFVKDPVGVTGAILMNYYIRLFPYTSNKNSGIWEITTSSKEVIKI